MAFLSKIEMWNPYQIGGRSIDTMHFFKDGKVIATHKRGWFGDNNRGCDELESIDFVRRVKVESGLRAGFSFYCKNVIYVNVDHFETFEVLGEEKAYQTNDEIYYAEFVNIKMTLGGKTDVYRIQLGSFTRSELTSEGEKLESFKSLLGDIGVVIPTYQMKKLLENIDKVKEFE